MSHSVFDTKELGQAINRYGPTAARSVSTEFIRLGTTTVDCHAHALVPEAATFVQPWHRPIELPFAKFSAPETRQTNIQQDQDRMVALADPKDRLAVLDAQGIDLQVVAPAPNQCYYDIPAAHCAKASRIVNDGVAAFVGTSDRLFGLGTIPLQDPAVALREFDYVMGDLGFQGVQILTNVNGKELSSPEFDKVWAKAVETDAVVMLHPLGFTEAQRFEKYYFTNVIGNPLDTTVALHHLIFGGVLERHPKLKIFAVHGGGFITAYSGRIDHSWGARRDSRDSVPNPPTSYLRKMIFDTTVFTPHQLEYLVRQFGPDHIVLGTDYPYDMAEYYPIQHLMSVESFTDAERNAVAGETAIKVFNLKR